MEASAERIARQYALDVVGGRVPACRWTRLACQRHLTDLERGAERGLRFNPARAQHVLDFIQGACRHVKGQWAGKLIVLEPWQVFAVAVLYGWERADGTRRFRRSYEEVARKNAKTTRKAGEALYGMIADLEPGAEVYGFATTFNQANILTTVAARMVDLEPTLRERIERFSKRLEHKASGSSLQPLHAKSRTQDGLNVHMAFADEFHAHPDLSMWSVLSTGTGARTQPLLSAITTAGSNMAGPCYELRDYLLKVLEGTLLDDELFGIVYTLDDRDDWTDPAVWAKANPNLGVSVSLNDLTGKLAQAKATPDAAAAFKTKHLNIWVGARKAFYDLAAWQACADSTSHMNDFKGCRCWIAFDLAQTVDVNVVVVLFERDGQLYAFFSFYLPEDRVRLNRTGTHAHFARWAEQGFLRLTPGDVVDLDAIERDLLRLAGEYKPEAMTFDPWHAAQLVTHLMEAGVPMVEHANTAKMMSPPMKWLSVLISPKARRLHHDGNPMMAWMMGNVTARPDAKDNVFPRKEFDQNKIDGPVALMMALGRAMAPSTQLGFPTDMNLLLPTV